MVTILDVIMYLGGSRCEGNKRIVLSKCFQKAGFNFNKFIEENTQEMQSD